MVKNLPALQETPVQFLGWEDPLEKRGATHSSILGLPLWLSWKRILLQCGRPGFDPWVEKIPGLGRSLGEGNSYPLQYSGWRIPWTEEPGRLHCMGSQRAESDTTDRLSLSNQVHSLSLGVRALSILSSIKENVPQVRLFSWPSISC